MYFSFQIKSYSLTWLLCHLLICEIIKNSVNFIAYLFRACKFHLCTRNFIGFMRKLGVVHFILVRGTPISCLIVT